MDGVVSRHGEKWRAVPREVVSKAAGLDSVIFEILPFPNLNSPGLIRVWWYAIRPENLVQVLGPACAVLFYGFYKSWEISWALVVSSLLGTLLFQIAVNALNDVEDYLRLIDIPGTIRGQGILQKGWLSARQLRFFGFASLIFGGLCGLPAVIQYPSVLLGIGAIGFVGVFTFSNRPFGIKYRSFGDGVIFFLLGPLLTLGFSYAFFGQADFGTGLLGMFFGFLSFAVSHSGNWVDLEFDKNNQILTLAAFLGFQTSRVLIGVCYLLAFLSVLAGLGLGVFPWFVSVILAGIPAFISLIKKVSKASGPASPLLGSIKRDTVRLQIILSVLCCAGMVLGLSLT